MSPDDFRLTEVRIPRPRKSLRNSKVAYAVHLFWQPTEALRLFRQSLQTGKDNPHHYAHGELGFSFCGRCHIRIDLVTDPSSTPRRYPGPFMSCAPSHKTSIHSKLIALDKESRMIEDNLERDQVRATSIQALD